MLAIRDRKVFTYGVKKSNLLSGDNVVWFIRETTLYLGIYRPQTNILSTYCTTQELLLGDSALVSMARMANIASSAVVVHEATLFDVPVWMNNAFVCFLSCGFYLNKSVPNKYTLADIFRFSCRYAAFCEDILAGGELDAIKDFFSPFSV